MILKRLVEVGVSYGPNHGLARSYAMSGGVHYVENRDIDKDKVLQH